MIAFHQIVMRKLKLLVHFRSRLLIFSRWYRKRLVHPTSTLLAISKSIFVCDRPYMSVSGTAHSVASLADGTPFSDIPRNTISVNNSRVLGCVRFKPWLSNAINGTIPCLVDRRTKAGILISILSLLFNATFVCLLLPTTSDALYLHPINVFDKRLHRFCWVANCKEVVF